MQDFESTDGMSEPCARGLRHLLLACADTKLLLGYHYGEWTFGTPALEAAVASCSLAQTELGHVRLLHALLSRHCGDDPDALVERRPAQAFAGVGYLDRPVETWPGFVAANLVVDLAVTRTLHALAGSAFRPLRASVDKMLDEERHHLHHGRGWFRTLAGREGDSVELRRQTEAAIASVVEWFGPEGEPEDTALVGAGVKAEPNGAIRDAVVQEVMSLAREAGISLAPPRPPDVGAWNPATRRAGDGGPEETILFRLRGTRNEVFKLA